MVFCHTTVGGHSWGRRDHNMKWRYWRERGQGTQKLSENRLWEVGCKKFLTADSRHAAVQKVLIGQSMRLSCRGGSLAQDFLHSYLFSTAQCHWFVLAWAMGATANLDRAWWVCGVYRLDIVAIYGDWHNKSCLNPKSIGSGLENRLEIIYTLTFLSWQNRTLFCRSQ